MYWDSSGADMSTGIIKIGETSAVATADASDIDPGIENYTVGTARGTAFRNQGRTDSSTRLGRRLDGLAGFPSALPGARVRQPG